MTGLDTATTWCQKLCGHLKREAATNWQTSSSYRGRQTISEVQTPPGSWQTILTERFQHIKDTWPPLIYSRADVHARLLTAQPPHLAAYISAKWLSILNTSKWWAVSLAPKQPFSSVCHTGEGYLNPSAEHLAALSRQANSHIEDHQP